MYNRVIFMGRLTREPELRTTQSGVTMCTFGIAVDRAYSRGQEKQTDFFEVICWRKTAEFAAKYFHKGQMIHLEGSMQNNNYTDQNGIKQYRMQVIAEHVTFCGDKQQTSPAVQQQPLPNGYQQPFPPMYDGNAYY